MPIDSEHVEHAATAEAPGGRPWYSKLLGVCFVIFCFEMGVFLVVFPWVRGWEINRAATYASWLTANWGSPFFRGALSGLGLVNIYISFVETVHLFRGGRSGAASSR